MNSPHPLGSANQRMDPRPNLRSCSQDEHDTMLTVINAAAEAYRGKIPADCWHEPYMQADELRAEIAAGVTFAGYHVGGRLAGVMGVQSVRDVDLIRHAYVLPTYQGRGVGCALIGHLSLGANRQVLVGTWAAATWAIGFYRRHGFELVPENTKKRLLRTYWTVSERQIETSVVLAMPHLTKDSGF